MKIAVIGTGYVGLVSGVCFSEFGFRVTCVDRDGDKIAKLQQHIMPIFEPGLEQLVESNRKAGRLSFSTDLPQAVGEADVVLIAVGTPQNETDGLPDLTAFHAVVRDVAKALKNYTLIIIKSTVPIGTNRAVAKMISELNPNADFDVASNPEFLREGLAVEDFMSPDRIVAGIDSKRASVWMTRLYEPVCLNGAQMFFTTFESAEMIKYAANCMLAMRISFINEIADFCEKTGANVRDVSKGVGMDHRIGSKFLNPGPGYGGSCFPKDTLRLPPDRAQRRLPDQLLTVEATITSNEDAQRTIVMAGKNHRSRRVAAYIKGKTHLAVLGLTFKPGTDDMREAASLVIVPELLKAGANVRAYDPHGMKAAAKLCSPATSPGTAMTPTAPDAGRRRARHPHRVERVPQPPNYKEGQIDCSRTPLVVDLRNIYKRQDMQKHGFQLCLHRPPGSRARRTVDC